MSDLLKEIYLKENEFYFSSEEIYIYTSVSSCVVVSIFDTEKKYGGICHISLGSSSAEKDHKTAEFLIKALLREFKDGGSRPEALEAKIVGGCDSLRFTEFHPSQDNINSTIEVLKRYNLKVVANSTGGSCSVDIKFYPTTGEIRTREKKEKARAKTKVLIVDDSRTIQKLLKKIISEDPRLEVSGVACDAAMAEIEIGKNRPDVITLDIQMPGLNGVEFLEQVIVPKYKIPTIMVSSLKKSESELVLKSLELGAFSYYEKPSFDKINQVKEELTELLYTAGKSEVKLANIPKKGHRHFAESGQIDLKNSLILIGASTGGTIALTELICSFPPNIPPTLMVLHIPEGFSTSFAERLNQQTPFLVKEACGGEELLPNQVLLAPGGKQMKVVEKRRKFIIEINDDAEVNRHKPSVDYLFFSITQKVRKRMAGCILTGMGADGAKGLLHLKNLGVYTIAQDKDSCVVFGMPKEAIKLGAAEKVLPLSKISGELFFQLSKRKKKSA
ncbi:MAG: chemotaxis-specific protein-glutamate methyltransferase CheB [Bacteriovoracaceae bacterium]|jgi:two-component system, chemotaxis family, protein-glutamate methylesterase/glutaminase|nr:chemotaxis-specific protein-glutamate methyltransferase CheB [Bacteriovoracaceae bacterium]